MPPPEDIPTDIGQVPGFIWRKVAGGDWMLYPDTTNYTGDFAKQMGLIYSEGNNKNFRLPNNWKAEEGVPVGFVMPAGIGAYMGVTSHHVAR
jgi:hypothetical protein